MHARSSGRGGTLLTFFTQIPEHSTYAAHEMATCFETYAIVNGNEAGGPNELCRWVRHFFLLVLLKQSLSELTNPRRKHEHGREGPPWSTDWVK